MLNISLWGRCVPTRCVAYLGPYLGRPISRNIVSEMARRPGGERAWDESDNPDGCRGSHVLELQAANCCSVECEYEMSFIIVRA